jgi:DNA-binding CsgD family transcriptional regulator
MSRFRAALDRPGVGAFLIHGPLGVGKTRLGDECLAVAEAAGHVTARAAATRAAAHMPLSALVHLLPVDDAGTDGLDPVSLFDRARRAVQERAGGRLVLFVDDLPALDLTSLVLLGQLVEADLVFLIATVRTGEPVPDAVTSLWAADRSVRVDLDPFGRDEVDAVLEAVLGGPIGFLGLAQLWDASHGNPLYLHEFVLGAVHDGTLTNDGGVWRLNQPLASTPRLQELVDGRIRSVDEAGRVVLELLALCQPVGLADLDGLADLALLDRLESAGLIEVTVSRRRHQVQLAHPAHIHSLRAGLSRIRQRALLLDQVARVESHGARRREDPLRIASWRLAATGTGDPHVLLSAAHLAQHAHDFDQVEALARAAYTEQPSVEAGLLLGEALLQGSRFTEAEEILQQASTTDASPEQTQHIALARAATLCWGLLRPADAFQVVDEACGRLPLHLHGQLGAMRALLLAYRDQPNAALAALDDLPREAGAPPSPLLRLAEARSLAVVGRATQAMAIMDAAPVPTLCAGPEFGFIHPSLYLMGRACTLQETGRLSEAVSVLTEALERAVADDVAFGVSFCLCHLGHTHRLQGRLRTAMRWCRDAISLARARRVEPALASGLAALAIAAGNLGDAAVADAAVDELRSLRVPPHARALLRAQAWADAARGDLGTARESLAVGAKVAIDQGDLAVASVMLHDAARLGDAVAVADQFAELAARCESPLLSARAGYVAGLATADPVRLDRTADEFERMGARLFAAEAAANAADLWRACGDQRRGTASASRAAALAEQCEGARTPALASTASVAPLTPREREICFLATSGLTSKEIADRAFLSVRTVNNHLQSAYVKLGISSRRELLDALRLAA